MEEEERKEIEAERALITSSEARVAYYNHLNDSTSKRKGSKKRYPRWRNGALIIKFPQDMVLYAQAIFTKKPDWIVETGTWFGGSACFLADMLMLNGGKGVITIDKLYRHQPPHPMVEYIEGSSTDLRKVFRPIRSRLRGKGSVMVILDSDHSTEHVAKELEYYSQLVSVGQYLVAEDSWTKRATPYTPYKAVQEFLKTNDNFKLKHPEDQFIFGVTRDGWLLREN